MLLITEKLIKQLSKSNLSTEDRIALTGAITKNLNAFPISNILEITSEGLKVQGKKLDVEQVIHFREACVILKDNFARKVIHEQVRYKAIDMGISKAVSVDTLMFAKASLWVLNEIEILINSLSTEE